MSQLSTSSPDIFTGELPSAKLDLLECHLRAGSQNH